MFSMVLEQHQNVVLILTIYALQIKPFFLNLMSCAFHAPLLLERLFIAKNPIILIFTSCLGLGYLLNRYCHVPPFYCINFFYA